MSRRAKKLFVTFSYLTLILVVAAFASIVAGTFKATFNDGVLDVAASNANASVAMVSLMFIAVAIIFGFVVTLCKISPDTGSYVKKVLNSSYDFNYIKVKTSEFLNNIKDYINFEEIFVWGE